MQNIDHYILRFDAPPWPNRALVHLSLAIMIEEGGDDDGDGNGDDNIEAFARESAPQAPFV